MKKTILKKTVWFTVITTLCLVVVTLFVAVGCEKNEQSEDKNEKSKIEIVNYPITVYSLVNTSCQWADFESNKVITINSDEELSNYIVCENNDYFEIDFSKHSLLLTTGWASGYPAEVVEIRLQQISKNEYSLHLKIKPGIAATPGRWNMSIIIPKLLQNAVIALDVQQINY